MNNDNDDNNDNQVLMIFIIRLLDFAPGTAADMESYMHMCLYI